MVSDAPGVVRGEHEGMDQNSNQRVYWTIRRQCVVSRLVSAELYVTNRKKNVQIRIVPHGLWIKNDKIRFEEITRWTYPNTRYPRMQLLAIPSTTTRVMDERFVGRRKQAEDRIPSHSKL